MFLTKGLTSMAFGSLWLPNGATIGLPRFVLGWPAVDCTARLYMISIIIICTGVSCSKMLKMSKVLFLD